MFAPSDTESCVSLVLRAGMGVGDWSELRGIVIVAGSADIIKVTATGVTHMRRPDTTVGGALTAGKRTRQQSKAEQMRGGQLCRSWRSVRNATTAAQEVEKAR